MNVNELKAQRNAIIGQAKTLAGGEVTAETAQQIDALLKQSDEVKSRIELAERMAEHEAYLSEPAGTKAAHLTGRVDVVKDEADKPFTSDGEFLRAVKNAALYPGGSDRRLLPLQIKASGLSEGVPADGGYLLQPNMAAGILERMYAGGKLLSRVASDPISQGNSITYNGIDETSRVSGSRWGGVTGYWTAEGGSITASKPTFRQIELKLKKIAALCYATDEQLEDISNLQSWLGRVVPEELRFVAENAIYNGTGAGMPLGIMNAPALVSPLRTDASTVKASDVLNMYARRWAGVNDYVWFINQDVLPQLLNLNNTYQNLYLPPGAWGVSPSSGALLGFPVVEVEYAASMGTTGDIVLASMSQYQTITKGGVRADSSIHVQFTTDEMAFRFVYRLDGAPTWHSALTPANGSNTQSPFVALATASS